MRTSAVTFRVEKCSQASHCKSDEEISNYIEDVRVQTWMIQEQINFRNYETRPTSKKMDIIDVQSQPFAVTRGSAPSLVQHTISYLQKNDFQTEDSWLWIGLTTHKGNFFTFSKSVQQQINED